MSRQEHVTVFNPTDYLLGEFEQLCGQLASMTVGALLHLTGPSDPLRLSEFRILAAIREREPVTEHRLGSALHVDVASLAAILTHLEERSLIRRSDAEGGPHISTTPFGAKLLVNIKQERQRWLKPALSRLDAWERGTLIGVMRFLIRSFPKDGQQISRTEGDRPEGS